MPFDGQVSAAGNVQVAAGAGVAVEHNGIKHEAKVIIKVPVTAEEPVLAEERVIAEKPATVYTKPVETVERKKFTQPAGKLSTTSPGIKTILDPPKNKLAENADALLPDLAEPFTHEQFKAAWNDYALNLKREMKDSLYATLMDSELSISSDYKILLEISNSAQANQLERERAGLLQHLRSKLRNNQIAFTYQVSEKLQSPLKDSKATFETLAAENPSLHKLRKMFNLDIDY